jgi:5,10-methylenetetrahydromethanopterin reductase
MDVEFGLRIIPCGDLRETAACARSAEDAGFGVAWIGDSQLLARDVWAAMALIADRTERIRIGSCVTTFEVRHPTVTASAVATIEEMAPGRVILGVGTGDSAVKTLGIRPTKLDAMRSNIALVRELLTGGEVSFEGDERTMRLRGAPGHRIPIYIAATGPKALALAGEVADGVIILAGIAPVLIERAVAHIREGAARVGRRFEEIDVCLGTFCYPTEDRSIAARVVKPYVVTSAQLGGSDALRSIGIDVEVPAVVPGVYPDMAHAEDWDQAIRAADNWVTDEMAVKYADNYCLVGNPSDIISKIETAIAVGISSFYIRHFSTYTLPTDLLEPFGRYILPHFAGKSSVSSSSQQVRR